MRDVEGEGAFLQARCAAQPEGLDLVGVVGDKQKRRAPEDLFLVRDQAHREEPAWPRNRERDRRVRRQPASPEAGIDLLPLFQDIRIEAEARVVEKEAAVDFADIDVNEGSLEHRSGRRFQIEGDAEAACERPEPTSREATVLTVPSPPPATIVSPFSPRA